MRTTRNYYLNLCSVLGTKEHLNLKYAISYVNGV